MFQTDIKTYQSKNFDIFKASLLIYLEIIKKGNNFWSKDVTFTKGNKLICNHFLLKQLGVIKKGYSFWPKFVTFMKCHNFKLVTFRKDHKFGTKIVIFVKVTTFDKGDNFKLVTFCKGQKFRPKGHKFGPKVVTFVKVTSCISALCLTQWAVGSRWGGMTSWMQ